MTIEQAIDDLMDTSKNIAEVAESESDEANRINAQNFADDCEQLAAWLRELVERRKADSCEGCVNESNPNWLVCYTCKRHWHYVDLYEERRSDK